MPLSGLTTSLVNIIRENNILFLKTNWPFDKNLDRADKQRCHWLEVKVFPKKKIIWEACIKDYTCHQNLITLPIHTLPIRYKLVILMEHFYLLLCLMNAINLHEPKILLNKSVGFYCFVVFFTGAKFRTYCFYHMQPSFFFFASSLEKKTLSWYSDLWTQAPCEILSCISVLLQKPHLKAPFCVYILKQKYK